MQDYDLEMLELLREAARHRRPHASHLFGSRSNRTRNFQERCILDLYLERFPLEGGYTVASRESPDFMVETVSGPKAFEVTELVDRDAVRRHRRRMRQQELLGVDDLTAFRAALSGKPLTDVSPLDRPNWSLQELFERLRLAIDGKEKKAERWMEADPQLRDASLTLLVFTSELLAVSRPEDEISNFRYRTAFFERVFLIVPGTSTSIGVHHLEGAGRDIDL